VLHKWLHLSAYKVQITHEIKPDDKPKQLDFATDMLHQISMNPGFLPSIFYSDKAMFHQSGKTDHHNTHIRTSENPHIHRQVV
jgi:hypothetical protein